MGGTCLNRGCIPTKSLLHASGLFREMKNACLFGLSAEQVSFSLESIQRYKEENVRKLRLGIEQRLGKQKITLFRGTAAVTGPHEVKISGKEEPVSYTHLDCSHSGSTRPQNSSGSGGASLLQGQ